jgi:nitrate/nitrite transporter NarK
VRLFSITSELANAAPGKDPTKSYWAAASCMRATPLSGRQPTMMLSEAAAAATFGLINSIGQVGGFVGNIAIGFLSDRTHSLASSFAFIALVYAAAGSLILTLRVRNTAGMTHGSN